MRHADPHITLRHDQQAIPAEVRAVAIAFESDLLDQQKRREEKLRGEDTDPRPV
jgi:hypothetical protein